MTSLTFIYPGHYNYPLLWIFNCFDFYIDCSNQKSQVPLPVLNCLTNIHIFIQIIISFTGRSHQLYQQSMVMIVILICHVHTLYYNPFVSIGYELTSWLLFTYDRAHLAQKHATGISERSWDDFTWGQKSPIAGVIPCRTLVAKSTIMGWFYASSWGHALLRLSGA